MAQNSGKQRAVRGRPFKKGVSPNPGGRPRGLMAYIRRKTRDGVTIADFMLVVMADANRKLDQRMEAATWLADRGFGKPVQALEHSGDPDNPVRTVLTWGDVGGQ